MSTAPPPSPATCPECGKDAASLEDSGTDQTPTHCEWCGAEYPVPSPPRPDPALG